MDSDHCPTVVTLYNKETFVEEAGTPRFKLSKADWRHFKRICNDRVTVESTSADTIDWHNDRLTEAIRAAAERSISHRLAVARADTYHSPTGMINARQQFTNEIVPEIN